MLIVIVCPIIRYFHFNYPMYIQFIFFLNSMKRADASFVMPFFYSTLIFVVILDFLIFSYIPDWVSFLGCFIIIVGALIVSLKDRENNY